MVFFRVNCSFLFYNNIANSVLYTSVLINFVVINLILFISVYFIGGKSFFIPFLTYKVLCTCYLLYYHLVSGQNYLRVTNISSRHNLCICLNTTYCVHIIYGWFCSEPTLRSWFKILYSVRLNVYNIVFEFFPHVEKSICSVQELTGYSVSECSIN